MTKRNIHSETTASPAREVVDTGRRAFLKSAAIPATALAAGATLPSAVPTAGAAEPAAPKADAMPRITIGKTSISRLVCGANPFNGGSHLSVFFNHQLREYYTPERILATLRRCEEAGIDCWQSGGGNLDLFRRYVDAGGKMHFLSIEGKGSNLKKLAAGGCIGVAHHGETTDHMFKSGQLDKIHDFLKQVHDAGLPAGISTHMPAVVDAVESKGWELDYYMTCVYERHRSKADLERLLGQAPIPVGEVYLPNDPPRMFQSVRATKRPCLAFKILAAGRLSEHPSWVEQAFRDTIASIKPIDGMIVGMYDRYSNQPAENAAFVRRYSNNGKARA